MGVDDLVKVMLTDPKRKAEYDKRQEEIEKEGTLPAEKPQPEPKPRRKKTEQQQILEVLKNIQRLLAIPVSGVARNDKDNKFIERMNK